MARGFTQSFKVAIGAVDTVQQEDLGVIRYTENAVYKYVKFSGTTIVAAGDPVGYVITDTTLQTVDPASFAVPAGIATVAVPTGTVQYAWIQIGGINTAVNGIQGGPSAGAPLYMNASKQLSAKSAVGQPEVGVFISGTIVQLYYPN